MNNMRKTNERVFRLTEGEIRKIVAESTYRVLDESLGSVIGKGLKSLWKGFGKRDMTRMARRIKNRGYEWYNRAVKYGLFKKPKVVKFFLQNLASPDQIAESLRKCCPKNCKVMSEAYEYVYTHKELWNQVVPGTNPSRTYGEFCQMVSDCTERVAAWELDDVVRMIENGVELDEIIKTKFPKAQADQVKKFFHVLNVIKNWVITLIGIAWIIKKAKPKLDALLKRENETHEERMEQLKTGDTGNSLLKGKGTK